MEKHYLVWEADGNGRDEVAGVFKTGTATEREAAAKELFDSLVAGGASYARYESVDVIGGDAEDGFEYDNNNTIESYYSEDSELE